MRDYERLPGTGTGDVERPGPGFVICALARPRCQQSRFSQAAMSAFAIYGARSVIMCALAVVRPAQCRGHDGLFCHVACISPRYAHGRRKRQRCREREEPSAKRQIIRAREISGGAERLS